MTSDQVYERLQALQDERDVQQTMYDYAHSLDYGIEKDFLDCFTPSGVWRSTRRGQPGRTFEGEKGLLEFFRGQTHAPTMFHKHLMIEPRITVKGSQALVESYFLQIHEHPDGAYVRSFGRYKDILQRSPDGRWRIADRLAEVESFVPKESPSQSNKP